MVTKIDMDQLAELAEQASDYFRIQTKILAWEGLRPGQRVAALVIHAMTNENMAHPLVWDVAQFIGVDRERCAAIFDGLEHPPFAVTTIDGQQGERFVPSQTLAYDEEYEGAGG